MGIESLRETYPKGCEMFNLSNKMDVCDTCRVVAWRDLFQVFISGAQGCRAPHATRTLARNKRYESPCALTPKDKRARQRNALRRLATIDSVSK